MDFVQSATSLVVAGAWNPAILSPEWVGRWGLKLEGPVSAKVSLPAFDAGIFSSPKFTINDFEYSSRPDALLVLFPETRAEKFGPAEQTTYNLLEALPHTPISGLGHNFEMIDENPDSDRLAVFSNANSDLFDKVPAEFSITKTSISSSLTSSDGRVVINVTREVDSGVLALKFNFHHPITTAKQALQILKGEDGYNTMAANMEIAASIAAKIRQE